MSVDTTSPARSRDGLLDLLRTFSIVRVVVIHVVGQAKFWFWPAPTWIAPGMPVVFFVSGSLAFRSLRTAPDGTRRRAGVYWRRTFKRLLLPYWAYYAVVSAFCISADLTETSSYWDVNYRRLLLGATGLIIPDASRPMRHHMGHVWFMCVFLVLAFAAPAMVRLFERARWALMASVVGAFAFVQWLVLDGDVVFEYEIEKVTAFAIPYLVGFWYTDGGLQRVSARVLAAAAAVAATGAVLWNDIEPGAVNASQTKHLLVGAAWLLIALAAAPALRRVADRFRSRIDRITPRTFTTYLWGWTTCVFVSDWVDELVAPGWSNRVLMAVGSIAALLLVVRMFGWVEDVSARPPRGGRDRRSAPTLQRAAG